MTRSVATTLESVGLAPWAGLYRTDRPGRPSLAHDPMEPLRPILADSAVLTALNQGVLVADGSAPAACTADMVDARMAGHPNVADRFSRHSWRRWTRWSGRETACGSRPLALGQRCSAMHQGLK